MAVDLNAYTPARYPVDAALANGNTPATRHLQGMIYRAFSAGGGIVELPAGAGTLVIDDTINLLTGVDLWIPKGCQIQVPLLFNQPLFIANGVTDVRIFGGGWIIGNYDFTLTLQNGIEITNSQEVFVEGVRIAGMGNCGVKIDGDGYNHVTRAVIHDNGLHGVYLTNATVRNKISDAWIYSNGQQGGAAGDGVHLDGATLRTLITNLHAFDPAASYAAAQAYPVREAAASSCDYTILIGMLASGNVTSDSPSFVGSNSKWLDSAATVALVGTPAAESVGATAALGTSLNAAPLDHVHALAASVSTPAALAHTGAVGVATTPSRSDHVHSATGNVGATPSAHLNTVLLASPVLTTISGSGDVALTAATLTSLPAEAVTAFIRVVFTNTTVGCEFRIAAGDNANILMDAQVAITTLSPMVNARVRVAPGASNQIQYAVVGTSGGGGAAWSALVTLQGYEVPA